MKKNKYKPILNIKPKEKVKESPDQIIDPDERMDKAYPKLDFRRNKKKIFDNLFNRYKKALTENASQDWKQGYCTAVALIDEHIHSRLVKEEFYEQTNKRNK